MLAFIWWNRTNYLIYRNRIHWQYSINLLQCVEHGCANHATEGKCFCPTFHYCDVTKPPYLLSGELCTSSLHSNRLYVYTVCCRRGGQCFSVLRTRHTDVVGVSSGRRLRHRAGTQCATLAHPCTSIRVDVGKIKNK